MTSFVVARCTKCGFMKAKVIGFKREEGIIYLRYKCGDCRHIYMEDE